MYEFKDICTECKTVGSRANILPLGRHLSSRPKKGLFLSNQIDKQNISIWEFIKGLYIVYKVCASLIMLAFG